MNTHFIAHEPADTVGVVVVEKVNADQEKVYSSFSGRSSWL